MIKNVAVSYHHFPEKGKFWIFWEALHLLSHFSPISTQE
jgi:hypothetical protein